MVIRNKRPTTWKLIVRTRILMVGRWFISFLKWFLFRGDSFIFGGKFARTKKVELQVGKSESKNENRQWINIYELQCLVQNDHSPSIASLGRMIDSLIFLLHRFIGSFTTIVPQLTSLKLTYHPAGKGDSYWKPIIFRSKKLEPSIPNWDIDSASKIPGSNGRVHRSFKKVRGYHLPWSRSLKKNHPKYILANKVSKQILTKKTSLVFINRIFW